MQKRESKTKSLRKLIAEIIKSPLSSPYKLSYALAASEVDMSPQVIYYYLDRWSLRSVSSRVELQNDYNDRKKSKQNKRDANC